MNKWKERAGFTLAELLIVVAIIAILVAIGVPAFSTAMERSRETVDLSNIRGAYAEYVADTLSSSDTSVVAYKITFKQRTVTTWVADVSGFLPNIENATMPFPAKTGDGYAVFYYKDGAEKPTLELVEATDEATETVTKTVS